MSMARCGAELSRVDEDLRPRRVCLDGDAVDVRQVTGDVGAAGDGDHAHAPGKALEQHVQVRLVEPAQRIGPHVLDAGTRAPRQVVAVVLQLRDQHHVVGAELEAGGQLVDRLGRVLAEDRDVRGAGSAPTNSITMCRASS